MLIYRDLFKGEVNRVRIAIERLKAHEPPEGYYLAFSGGKDSVVIKKLAFMAGVKFDAHYSLTTIDPPDLVQFIKKFHPDVAVDKPKKPFLKELVNRGFPMRQNRWCCAEYKERGGNNRIVVTGVRWAESHRRAKRRLVETCYKDITKTYLNVIIDWKCEDVWEFIKQYNVPYCHLYDEGFLRLGCVLCPFARGKSKQMEIDRFPKIVIAWKKAFVRLYENRKKQGKTSVDRWRNGEEMFNWWLSGKGGNNKDSNQGILFE